MTCGNPLVSLNLCLMKHNQESSPSNGRFFVAALKACADEQDLKIGQKIHAYVTELGFLEDNKFIGSTLVNMYAKCKSLSDAKSSFDMIGIHDVVSWTAIIGGYVENGDEDGALLCFEHMRQMGVAPNAVTYIWSLKACSIKQQQSKGQQMHCEIEMIGLLAQDPNLGNSLIDMYAKCGCFHKAHKVFDRLPTHDVISWTALLGGYVRYSCDEEALTCLENMKKDNVHPSSVTIIVGLKVCSGMRSLDKGRQFHVVIEKEGWFYSAPGVGNALIDMYAKCGALAKAHQLFDMLPLRDAVSWSCLINGYAEQGFSEEAIALFKRMHLVGVSADAVTYVCILKACGRKGALAEGQDVHAEIERLNLLKASDIGNSLVHMYGKCGVVAKAEEVFDSLPVRDLISWNVLLAGHIDRDLPEKVIQSFERMQLEGIFPDAVTFVYSLKACKELGIINKGLDIHAEIERVGSLEANLCIGNTLVDMYSRCGLLERAWEVFSSLPSSNVISWNALISGYAEQGDNEVAFFLSEEMQAKGVIPDVITYMCTLDVCSSLGDREQVGKIHEELERRNLVEESLDVNNTLIDSYAKCGLLKMARHVFNALKVVDCVSWNALITGYTRHEQYKETINCVRQMHFSGVTADSVTFVCALKAVGSMGFLIEGEDIHAEIERRGLLKTNVVVSSALIEMYANCGFLSKGQSVFDQLSVRGVISWTVLMAGYAQIGQSQTVFSLFDKMIGEKIEPDMVTFVTMLNVCGRSGLFGRSQMYFEVMSEKFGIIPSFEHQVCIVDILGRLGELDLAFAMIRKLSTRPNLIAWHSILAASRGWGSFSGGNEAFKQALSLDGLIDYPLQ